MVDWFDFNFSEIKIKLTKYFVDFNLIENKKMTNKVKLFLRKVVEEVIVFSFSDFRIKDF